MTAKSEWTAEQVEGVREAIEEVHYRFACFTRTNDMLNQAHHLTELANAVSDLMTWHPSYDLNTGTLGWERDDEDYPDAEGLAVLRGCSDCNGYGYHGHTNPALGDRCSTCEGTGLSNGSTSPPPGAT